MSSFTDTVARFQNQVAARSRDVFVNTASAAHQSIVEGSPITGAPGQPVDTGNLRNSWQLSFETPDVALISTNVEYAEAVEDNIRGVTFKNHGPHSIKLTVAGFDRIVANENAKAAGSNG